MEKNQKIKSEDIKEACGLIAITNHENAAQLCAEGLFALQHRGEEACGICALKDKEFLNFGGLGFVNRVFQKENLNLGGYHSAIGHTRYATNGSQKDIKNIQPLFVKTKKKTFAVAHNGNLVNADVLKKELEENGAIFQSSSDTEIILHLIVNSKKNFEEALIDACRSIQGAFSLVIINEDGIYAIRDSYGFKPLCYGALKQTESLFTKEEDISYIVASETPALDLVEAQYIREIKPGEMVFISLSGTILSKKIFDPKEIKETKKCIFELIYFSRPDSYLFEESVYDFRKQLGRFLAQQQPVEADMVIPIPDSGNIVALGYAQEANIPLELAITKNLYASRSFIQSTQTKRKNMVRMKLNPISNMIRGKKIILIDDSIVRGTTMQEKIESLRQCGAKEIHLRIASAKIMHPCYYGINFPQASELIANKMNIEEMRKFFLLDSLAYLSIDAMVSASKKSGFCLACFNGQYPTPTFDKK